VLFGNERPLEAWGGWIAEGRVDIDRWTLEMDPPSALVPSLTEAPIDALLPLAVHRDGRVIPVDDRTRLRRHDQLELAIVRDRRALAHDWLHAAGMAPLGLPAPALAPETPAIDGAPVVPG
jgi:hypothetical protein